VFSGAFKSSAASVGAALAVFAAPLRAADDAAAPAAVVAAADPFSALVGGKSAGANSRRGVQRFAIASDGRMFLVEGKVGRARLKYLCAEGDTRLDCALDPEAYAEEIFPATGARGPRGDIIYKSENGDVLLRIMSYGGATVFWPGKVNGEAASKSYGDDSVLDLPHATLGDATRRASLASAKLAQLIGRPIEFGTGPAFTAATQVSMASAPATGSPDASVLADAIVRVAAGMAAVALDQTGAKVLGQRIDRVAFVEAPGRTPGLSLKGKTLTVAYDPAADVAGRPSSRAVREFLENSL
jgi:hypothetical protein